MLRTRHETVDFFCLIFSISLRPAPLFASPATVASAVGVDVGLVRQVEACGLLRSAPSGPNRTFDADDARIVAIVAEMLDLGATIADLESLGAGLVGLRGGEAAEQGSDTVVAETRALLLRMAETARAGLQRRRVARIAHAVDSIDALVDLV